MTKCELIIFRTSKKEFTQTLPGGQEETNCVKLLGLHIDNNYRFYTHTEKVCQKLRFKIANISRVRPYLSESKAKLLTESLVLSTVGYMAMLYLRVPNNQKKIQKMINLAARTVLRAPPREHVVSLLRELYWLNSRNYYEYLLICALRRIRKGLMKAPITYNELFIHRNLDQQRTRNTDIQVQWTRMNSHGLNSFAVNSCAGYNKYNLNPELFLCEESFKIAVKFRIFSNNDNSNVT